MEKKMLVFGFSSVYLIIIFNILFPCEFIDLAIALSVSAIYTLIAC